MVFKSRAFSFGYLLAGTMLFIFYGKTRFKISDSIKAIILVFFLLVSISFFIKRDSSLGRLFIYKISFRMFRDNFISGVGSGKFGYEYLNYQYDYFKNENYSIKELLLADNTKHAFNDYFQFAIENGVFGLFIIIFLIFFVFYSGVIAIKKYPDDRLLLISISQIIAIGIAALFTHVFEHTYFRNVVLCCVITIVISAWHNSVNRLKLTLFTISAGVLMSIYPYYLSSKENGEWEEANALYQSGYITEARLIYLKLYPAMKNNVLFLDNYSNLLYTSNRLLEQEAILERIVSMDNASVFHLKLARCYKVNGKFEASKNEYLKAIYTVPGRLLPRYELFQLYLEGSQLLKAHETGEALLRIPVKIPSAITQMIRTKTKALLLNGN